MPSYSITTNLNPKATISSEPCLHFIDHLSGAYHLYNSLFYPYSTIKKHSLTNNLIN